jgi:divalent metal cation (Fe/Co/Zn/Cd) transporter
VLQRSNEIFSDRARLKVEDVCRVAFAVNGVLGCHSVRTRGLASQIHVDLHVQVNPNATVAAGHAIAEEVERTVCESLPGVVDVIVHLEPFDEYQYKKTKEELGDTGLASKQSV